MSVRPLLLALSLSAVFACGDDGGNNPPIDAPKDTTSASKVMEVTCPATVAATFTTQAASFSPATASINVGQVAKFVSTATHPIGPFPGGGPDTDSRLVVPETQTKCFMFTGAGTFKFVCTVHGYLGTLTVN